MAIKKHLATISILVKDRQMHAQDVQKILTENAHLIFSRTGINVQRSCVEHCTGVIAVVLEGTKKEITSLTKKFDEFYGIVAKSTILTD